MTEAEWDACADPKPMLEFLEGKLSDRKLRLFAVACSQRIGRWLVDERGWTAINVADRFADGLATEEERVAAQCAAHADAIYDPEMEGILLSLTCAAYTLYIPANQAAHATFAYGTLVCQSGLRVPEAIAAKSTERVALASLLRCIVGSLFHPIAVDASWLAWNDGTVHKLAQAIYNDRAHERLPLLADALEDAGCTDAAILSHCREQGEHVRGCWVVDLLLGKS